MAYEINRFQTFLGHGERRNADIVLGSDRWNDRIEIRGFRIRFKAEHLRQSLGDIDIEADRGLAVLRKEFGGSVRRVHADGELAVLRHIIGQQFGDVIVFLHRRNVITRQFARFRTAIGRSRIVASITGAACRSSKQHRNAQRTRGNRLQTFLRFHILLLCLARSIRPNLNHTLERASYKKITATAVYQYVKPEIFRLPLIAPACWHIAWHARPHACLAPRAMPDACRIPSCLVPMRFPP